MVADEEERPAFLAEILFEGVVDMVLGVNKQLPNHAQYVVDPIGMADFSSVNRFFDRYFFHISLSFHTGFLSLAKWAAQRPPNINIIPY